MVHLNSRHFSGRCGRDTDGPVAKYLHFQSLVSSIYGITLSHCIILASILDCEPASTPKAIHLENFSCQIPTLPITIASYLHLGRACPPHWVFQGFVALGQVSGGNRGRDGRWAHPPVLATLGKMALGTSVGFLSIGRSD